MNQLINAPHHVHQADGSVQSMPDIPGMMGILDKVENMLLH